MRDWSILFSKKVNQLTSALHMVRPLFQLLFVSYLNFLFLMKLHFDALLRTTSWGFEKHSGLVHVHSVLANLLVDADKNGDLLVFGALNVSRGFDSSIHGQILLKALQRGVSSCIISPLYSMYNKILAVILIPSPSGTFPSKEMLSVKKGVRQGGKTSLSLFNNAIIEAQQVIKPSCFFCGINLSLLNFTDDIFHVSHSISLLQQNYDSLAAVYKQIRLPINESKTELRLFNGSKNELSVNLSVKIGDTLIKPCESLTYLCLPISSTLKDTRSALTNHFSSVYECLTDYLLPISIASTALSLSGCTMLLLPPSACSGSLLENIPNYRKESHL